MLLQLLQQQAELGRGSCPAKSAACLLPWLRVLLLLLLLLRLAPGLVQVPRLRQLTAGGSRCIQCLPSGKRRSGT